MLDRKDKQTFAYVAVLAVVANLVVYGALVYGTLWAVQRLFFQ